jgi:hypothetical protein
MSVYALSAETSEERLVPVSASSGIDRLSESFTMANRVESLSSASAACAAPVEVSICDILGIDVAMFTFNLIGGKTSDDVGKLVSPMRDAHKPLASKNRDNDHETSARPFSSHHPRRCAWRNLNHI